MIARKLYISGEVQGVGFRYFAQRAAAKHQVRGYVRTLEDGRVETVVQGAEKAVDGFRDDMTAGHSYSRVDGIEEIVVEPNKGFLTFRIEK